ncbi:hypothetical protein BO86DRAFT_1030 [Aspergillus japonicus CBS 114.51]|uniref:Uncharacterized protein n=1 Tax=Aspergillus japonicus CBS 114.51 TaxID=1448312 RepID=A0A8T8XHE2_ASPJA|nr:hypothetical protein BO86DRAFT_1030 [Aspergillus japonicus CBS 114.51]RAH87318.1 hypothetical protein BO86DRAFT_1030 [Aspergillus japonicus CBS 114.51]
MSPTLEHFNFFNISILLIISCHCFLALILWLMALRVSIRAQSSCCVNYGKHLLPIRPQDPPTEMYRVSSTELQPNALDHLESLMPVNRHYTRANTTH